MPPDEDDPMHPDQHGGGRPPEDIPIGDEPDDPLDDDNQPDYNTGPDPDDNDGDQEYITPDDHGPPPDDDLDMPGIQDSARFLVLMSQLSRLLILDKMMTRHRDLILLLNRFEFKGNRDTLPKAKAKVIAKKPEVQLPGHAQPISVPTVKPVEEEDDYHEF